MLGWTVNLSLKQERKTVRILYLKVMVRIGGAGEIIFSIHFKYNTAKDNRGCMPVCNRGKINIGCGFVPAWWTLGASEGGPQRGKLTYGI